MGEPYTAGVSIKELADFAGKARTTILSWRDNHNLFSTIQESEDNPDYVGKRYDLHAVQTVLAVKKLQDKGVSFTQIKKAVHTLKEHGEDLAGSVLYTNGEGIYKINSKQEVAESLASNPGQLEHFATLVDLEEVKEKAIKFYQEKNDQEPEEKVRKTA